MWGAWLLREGRETYAYLTLDEPLTATLKLRPRRMRHGDLRRRQAPIANAEIVFDALDEAHDHLYELLASQQIAPRSEDSLFPSRRAPRRASSPATRRVSFTFQASD